MNTYLFDVALGLSYLGLFVYMLTVAVGEVPDDQPSRVVLDVDTERLPLQGSEQPASPELPRAA